MTDDPFYAPNLATAPRRQPQPGEKLFEFLRGHDRYLCELRDHGVYGIEAQFWENEEFRYSRRFETRAAVVDPFIATDAAQWADKAALEETPNSFLFPTTGRGFTKGRIEPYARPLALDLRLVPMHLDQVGPALNAGINSFNDKWYDDRISVSPAVSAIEGAVHAPAAVLPRHHRRDDPPAGCARRVDARGSVDRVAGRRRGAVARVSGRRR